MKDIQNPQYTTLGFPELTEKIHKEHYNNIAALCLDIKELVAALKKGDLSWNSIGYITVNERILKEVESYMNNRRLISLPYIINLSQKNADGHNCSTCSGRCELQHSERSKDFNTGLQQLKESMALHIKVSLQIYKTAGDDQLKVLNYKMILLHNHVNELLDIEEEYLLPGIKQAQKNINAHQDNPLNDVNHL